MKKFTPFLFSSSLILPSVSFAIGLSGIQVSSHLNQPLSAQIQLMAIDGIAMNEIQVTLASSNEYDAVGMERSYELAKVRFSLTRKNGKTLIEIHSDTPIEEPYLQFLLDIRWPNGKMMRGYTVLLDPPNYKVVAKPIAIKADTKKVVAVKGKSERKIVAEADGDEDDVGSSITESRHILPSVIANESNPTTAAATASNTTAVANAPNLHEDFTPDTNQANTPANATQNEKPVVAKQTEPVDSIPTMLQAPDSATMSQPTPMKQAAKTPTEEIEDIDDAPTAELSAPERSPSTQKSPAPTSIPVPVNGAGLPPQTPNAALKPSKPAASGNNSAQATPHSLKVAPHDSLWNIAKKVQVPAPVDLNQVMLALKKANPDAFIHNNLNGLKQGAVLTIPNYNMMKSVQAVDAVKSVTAQNEEWKNSDTAEKPLHPLVNIPAKTVTVSAPKPQLNFRVTDIEQTPTLKPGENSGNAPKSVPSPSLSVAASAASQAQQSDAFLKNSMSDYAKANEVLKKRLSAAEQENGQLRAELIKLTETIQEQGIKRQSVKVDVQEAPNLPTQAADVDLDAPEESYLNWWAMLIFLLGGTASGVWWWQRRGAYDSAEPASMATPKASPVVYGTTPAAQSLRFSQMEKTVIEPQVIDDVADVGDVDDAGDVVVSKPREYLKDNTGATPVEGDPWATKLDLAHAYIAMEDPESAIPLLREVMESGDETQRQEAHSLLTKLI